MGNEGEEEGEEERDYAQLTYFFPVKVQAPNDE